MRILQEGAVRRLFESVFDSTFHPLLQLLGFQSMDSSHYLVILSDGLDSLRCIAEDAFARKLDNGEIRVLTIGTINAYSKTMVKGVECIVIRDFAMLVTPASQEGSPCDIEHGESPITTEFFNEAPPPLPPPPPAAPKLDTFTPIRALSTFSTDWTIRARVTKKWDLKEWNNSRGTGKLFTANLMDSLGDEIAATFFNQGAEMFYPLLTEQTVYVFSKGQVKLANKKFATVQSEYQLCFDKNAEIRETPDDGTINSQGFHIVRLDQLSQLTRKNGALVDVCAVIKEIGELTEFTSKRGDVLKKRTLVLTDPSQHTVELTLWNEDAVNAAYGNAGTTILLGKSVKVSEFNNVSLGTDKHATKLIYNPEGIQEVEHIVKWRDHLYDPQYPTTHLSVRCSYAKQREYRTIRSVNEEWQLCTNLSAVDVFIVRAHINFIKSEDTVMWYESCFNGEKCKKKVTREGDLFKCEACGETSPKCVYRYAVPMKICDETDGIWISAFDEKFVDIIGISADDLKKIQDKSEDEYREKVSSCLNQRLEFVLRATVTDGGQGPRAKFGILSSSQVDSKRVIKALLSDLAVMMSLQPEGEY